MTLLGSTTASDIVAAVGSAVGDNVDTLYLFAAVAISIPLAFWLMHAIIGLFPRSRGRKS